MALQGQTVIAASGDAGSEDCLPTNGSDQLAVDLERLRGLGDALL